MEVAGRHPLKQGLKPKYPDNYHNQESRVAGRHPLKQGLKHILSTVSTLPPTPVAGRHPLKQGLKPLFMPFPAICYLVSQGGIH